MDDMIRAVQPQGKWRVLVIDSASLKTLNAVCKMYDILEQNIALVENIERKRTPNPEYEAIYYLTPSAESVTALINDFTQGRPLYQAAHVFFTSTLSERLFEKMKRGGLTTYLRKMLELNVDYLAVEQCVFHLDLPAATRVLYNAADMALVSQQLSIAAKKLVSVCATLGEYPLIRYYDPKGERRSMGARLAFLVQEELDALCRLDSEFPPKSSYPRALLLVTDRAFDMLSPFVHDFMYQAMAADLVPTDAAGKFVLGASAGSPAATASVDEADALWIKYRHTHIADVSQAVTAEFKAFMERNPAAKSAAGQLAPGAAAATGVEGLAQLKNLVFALPQFQEAKAKYSDHINLCQECMQQYTKLKLERVSTVEQDLVTGRTGEGKAVKDIEVDLVPLLSDAAVQTVDKLRLLILYIVSHDGISDLERQKLLQCAQLTVEDAQVFTNLGQLGVRLTQQPGAKPPKDGRPRYSYEGVVAHEKTRKKKDAADERYVNSRWTPLIKYVAEDALCNKLDPHIFPFVKEPAPGEISGAPGSGPRGGAAGPAAGASAGLTSAPIGGFGQVTSLRSTKPSWARRAAAQGAGDDDDRPASTLSRGISSSAAATPDVEFVDLRKNGPRVILFVAGGASYSELRSAYDAAREYSRDVIVGATHLLRPGELVAELRDMHRHPADGRGGLRDSRASEGSYAPRTDSASAMAGRLGDMRLDDGQGSSSRTLDRKRGLFGKLKF